MTINFIQLKKEKVDFWGGHSSQYNGRWPGNFTTTLKLIHKIKR